MRETATVIEPLTSNADHQLPTLTRGATYDLEQFGIVRLPSVALSFDGDGTGLTLSVVQGYERADGTAFNRRLTTNWSMRTDDMTEAACQIVGRDLTKQEWKQLVGEIVPKTCAAS